jgi:hypothetical protein
MRYLHQKGYIIVSTSVRWDSEDQDILYFAIQNDWTWKQLQQQIDTAVELAVQAVPVIVDLRSWTGLPSSNLFLPDNLKPAKALLARNLCRQFSIVIVGANSDARMLYDCLRMLDSRVGWQVYFTETLDAARDFLQRELAKRPA